MKRKSVTRGDAIGRLVQDIGRHNLYKKEQKKYISYLDKKLYTIAQRLPRLEATNGGKKKAKCITCDKICSYRQLQGAHFLGRKFKYCKYERWNIHAACVNCNKFDQEQHKINYTIYMYENYGKDFVQEQIRKANKRNKGWMYDELQDKIKEYEVIYKKLGYTQFL